MLYPREHLDSHKFFQHSQRLLKYVFRLLHFAMDDPVLSTRRDLDTWNDGLVCITFLMGVHDKAPPNLAQKFSPLFGRVFGSYGIIGLSVFQSRDAKLYWFLAKNTNTKGQLISEWLFRAFNFPKKPMQKIWWISALEFKKWLNQTIED